MVESLFDCCSSINGNGSVAITRMVRVEKFSEKLFCELVYLDSSRVRVLLTQRFICNFFFHLNIIDRCFFLLIRRNLGDLSRFSPAT